MIRPFAAHFTNVDTNDESMIVANSAEEAETLGAEHLKDAAERGIPLEMAVSPCDSFCSYPTGELLSLQKV